MAENQEEETKKAKDSTEKPDVTDRIVTTEHSLTVAGKTLKYTAKAGTVVLREEDEKEGHQAKAEMFFISFTLNDVPDPTRRPVTFSFNGGPGSSSVWLLLGALGPKRVPMSEDASQLKPPFRVVDNEFTLLTKTDLVFIDPVGTGYSRMITGDKVDPDEFFSLKRDIECVGEFIRQYTSREKRWSSPKFLIGESYGTTRAAGLSGHLQDRYGLFLNGIMLVSAILNFQTLRFSPGNDLPYVLYLPSYAASAWHHGKLAEEHQGQDLEIFLQEVRDFAEDEYAFALMQGSRLAVEEFASIAARVASYTGLSVDYVERSNLRIEIMRFTKELLRSDGLTVGRFDSRIKGQDKDDVGERFEKDPSFDVVQGVYSACLNDYVRSELEFESDLIYEILSFKIQPKWKYDTFQNSYVNTAETLRAAIMKNSHLKVLVGNGYYDLATPFFATEYTFDHLGLKPDLQSNIKMTYYEAGHMMYIHHPSLAKLLGDVRAFITRTLAP